MLSSAKSLDDEAARLAVLRDPKRMASLLVRAFSSSIVEAQTASAQQEEDEEVEETQEEFEELEEEAQRESEGPLRVVVHSAAEEDEDDADEEEEEAEEEAEEEEQREDRPLDEDELEAAATALETATRIVEELRLKMLLKAEKNGEKLPQEASESTVVSTGSAVMTPSQFLRSESNISTGRPGTPVPQARVRSNSMCPTCNKSFNAFHRSKNCSACGFAFCPKCSAKNVVLPSSFGYRDESVRACDPCARWFQKALDRYFDVVSLTKKDERAVRRSTVGDITIEEKLRPQTTFNSITGPASTASDGTVAIPLRRHSSMSSPETASSCPNDESVNDLDEGGDNTDRHTVSSSSTSTSTSRRRRRHGSVSSAPSPSMNKNKPWFRGHLSAMHMNDRLPRKKKVKSEGDGDGDGNTSSPELRSSNSRRGRLGSVTSFKSGRKNETSELQNGNSRVGSDNGESKSGSTTSTAVSRRGSSIQMSITAPANGSDSSLRPQRKSRRSKFSRSASFDFTNLQSASTSSESSLGSPDMKRCNTFGPDETNGISDDASSGGSHRSNSMRGKKAFDDSDIIDARAQTDSADVELNNEAKLSAAVLRFAVYEMGGKENAGLRRTFGFTKANPVLNRYTLELDCRQRIVRAKSVFMHRFWSFHCDSVQSFVFGSSEGMASLVIFNGGQGNQSLELKFANDDEREQFKQAIDSCRSTNLHRMRGFAARAAMSLPARPEHPVSPVLDNLRPPTLQESNTSLSGDASSSASEFGSTHDTGDSNSAEAPMQVPLLPGEVVVKNTEFPATLLIGPASETYESTQLWGRIRGRIAVTNYRVMFIPLDRVQRQPQSGGQGGIAYVPLFAIVQVQLLFPGGRKTKSGRTYSAGMAGSASIISISCKDVRILRFQLDTQPNERTQKLRATIARMADASQRYAIVERRRTVSPGLGPIPSTPDSNESPTDGESRGDDTEAQDSKGAGLQSTHLNASISRSPVTAQSPVLRPDRILTLPHEVSGSFAFSYSIDDVPIDQDGWRLFVDEREFKRQIGRDPSVSPFLKFYNNSKGNICKSYPSKLLLPASMNSATVVKVADFRAKGRLPVITYYHRRNRCVLTRSSQPLLGNLLSGASNVQDQLLLGVYRRLPDIIKNQSQSSASARPIYIFDARKPKASTGNRLMGKGGVETPQDYPGAVVHHLNIANMYRMQSSFMGLMKLFLPGGLDDTDKTWLSSVESTRWLEHVRLVLDGALKIARVLELEGASALVHCSDGWDRTAQLCALAQLMIDPYYRTIRGFAVLVEKDWCAFGHKFSERTGGDRNRDPQRNKSSPIMFQFIDAVWQVQRQYPRSFEFNERFLLHLANSMTSGLYGTFLHDSRLQRDVSDVEGNSVSVWTPVLLRPSQYSNSSYEMYDGPIWPWTSSKMIRLWDNYFFQWHPKFYKCQWACSLTYHVPSNADGSTSGIAETTDSSNGDDQLQRMQQLEGARIRESLDLLATPITSTITEDDSENEVPTMNLSSDDEDNGRSIRTRTSSGSYLQNIFGLGRGNRQMSKSGDENDGLETC